MKGIDTMTTKKLTKRDHFNALLNLEEVKTNPILVEFIEHELDLLAKKNAADKKPTAQQTANKAICEAIVEGMEPNRLYTITELIKEIPECADLTNQRVSALVRGMIDIHIERVEEKRKAYFRLLA
jgi:hypothetical protein